jgi:hypothetical protein
MGRSRKTNRQTQTKENKKETETVARKIDREKHK